MANLKAVEKKAENEDLKVCREVVEKCGLDKIGMMVCGELESVGGFLTSRDDLNTKSRIETLIQESLIRLTTVRTVLNDEDKEGSLEGYDFNGVQLAVSEVCTLLKGAFGLSFGGCD